jgi:polar amino acid transport system substrate-binding protein
MKYKMLLAALVCVLASTIISAKDTQVIVYADQDYPPYAYKESGSVKGIYTDILKAAFARMQGYSIEIKALPYKRGLAYLEKGTGFAIYPPYHRTKARPYIWPYSIPILDEKVVVFCREGVMEGNPRTLWPEDYYGLKIGNNAGYKLGGDKFWAAVKSGKIKLKEGGSNSKNILKLGLKRTDCYMNDRISILWELNRLKHAGTYNEGTKHVKLIEAATITIEQGFLGYTDRDNGKFAYKNDFVRRFDAIIYDMRKSGELQGIITSYLQ